MHWDPHVLKRNAVLGQLAEVINLDYTHWPTVAELNHHWAKALPVRFIEDEEFIALGCSYEESVAKGGVPTRAQNWHDLFGAIIWHLFPRTKALLNQLHSEHITQFGAKQRTPRRDRITHFDECGMVLAVPNSAPIEPLLRQHQWQTLFIKQREHWHKHLRPFVFGHALYEQTLTPFIGMTGKCVVLAMPEDFFSLAAHEAYPRLDAALAKHLEQTALFDQKKPLRPLPLLGIPGWWPANEDIRFYQNTDYFRPAPAR